MHKYERDILDFALSGEHPDLDALRRQLGGATVVGRLNLGNALRIELESKVTHDFGSSHAEITDCFVEFSSLQNEVAITLILINGRLSALVLVANGGEKIPTNPSIHRLYYTDYDQSGELIECHHRNLQHAILKT